VNNLENKTVLWISRHHPLEFQKKYLRQKLGDYNLIIHELPLSTADEAVKLAKEYNADYVIPVLPLSFIAYLVNEAKKHGFTVLRAEMENLHNCEDLLCPRKDPRTDTIIISEDLNTGKTIFRHFRFKEFVKLVAIEIKTEKW